LGSGADLSRAVGAIVSFCTLGKKSGGDNGVGKASRLVR
jgi:hypothetical protein